MSFQDDCTIPRHAASASLPVDSGLAAPGSLSKRWTFTVPSPVGDVSSSWELTADGVHCHTDAPMNPVNELLRWDSIGQAATAVMGKFEWLLASRTDGTPVFMQLLPRAPGRDAIVDAARRRLGSRWLGERLPLEQARKRLGASASMDKIKVALIILSVPLLLYVLLIVVGLVGTVLWLPAVIGLGVWLFYKGLLGFRDALHVANTPTARVSSAAMGLVEIKGRPVAEQTTRAAASGLDCVWWEVSVDVWQRRSSKSKSKSWCEVMTRKGGKLNTLVIEDDTGRVPVWLRGADLLLREHTWEDGKDELPPAGMALLKNTDYPWAGARKVRVRERRIEARGLLYVLGTLDEARQLHVAGDERGLARVMQSLRSGEWRKTFVQATPAFLRPSVTVTMGYLDMFGFLGSAGRGKRLGNVVPPALDPHAVVMWKGRAGRPLTVSDKEEVQAIWHLRKRSLWYIAGGIAVLCFALNEIIKLF